MSKQRLPFSERQVKFAHDDMENSQQARVQLRALSGRILHFTPSWFAVIMGTGITAALIASCPLKFNGQIVIASIIFALNVVLFLLFSALTIARYIMFPYVFKKMITHPVQSLYVGCLPMGFATLINCIVFIVIPTYPNLWIVPWVMWWVDVFMAGFSVFAIPIVMIVYQQHTLEKMTATWLLPIVPAVVASGTGGLVASIVPHPTLQVITIIFSYILFSVGIAVSFSIIVIYLHRLTIYHFPPNEVIVSVFLPLGPLGQGTFAVLQMATSLRPISSHLVGGTMMGDIIYWLSVVLALSLWSYGIFWLLVAVYILPTRSPLTFNMGHWAFTFPLGVFISGTFALGKALQVSAFNYIGAVLLVILVILWLCVGTLTLRGAIKGSLFVAPCLSDSSDKHDQAPEEVADNDVGSGVPAAHHPSNGKPTPDDQAHGTAACKT